MKVFAFLFSACFLSFTNFLCSEKSKFQDFTGDSTDVNNVRQSLTDTLLLSPDIQFYGDIVAIEHYNDLRKSSIGQGVTLFSLSQ